jgi:hypothetical protein
MVYEKKKLNGKNAKKKKKEHTAVHHSAPFRNEKTRN